MKSQLFGILAILSLLAGCANMPSQDAWNTLTGQDNRSGQTHDFQNSGIMILTL
jgi:hypothetical protein